VNRLLVALIILVGLASCEPKELRDCLEGEGSSVVVQRSLQEINALTIDIPCTIEIYQDTTSRYGFVDVLAQRNVADNIEIRTADSNASFSFKKCFKSHNDITLKFNIPHLNSLQINSASELYSKRILLSKEFDLVLNESVSGHVVLQTEELRTRVNSTANIYLEGYTPYHKVYIQSAGVCNAFNLITDSTRVEITGSGQADIYIDKVADIYTDGGGLVRVKGDSLGEIREQLNGGAIDDLRTQ